MLKILSIFLIALTACAYENPANSQKLKIAIPIEPISLVPFTSNEKASYRVRWQIFEHLVKADRNGVIKPVLAVSWEDISPETVRLSLRSNVYFHNGEEFTAEDAAYSVNAAANSLDLIAITGVIKNAEVVDRYTIDVNFHEPYGAKTAILGQSGILMTSKSAMESNPESVIGTGAYTFKNWERGQKVELARFDDYWGGKPYFEEAEFIVIPESSVRSIVVETGDAHVAYDVDESDKERILSEDKLKYYEDTSPAVNYVGFNLTKPQFQDVRLRQALAAAIDYDGIINQVVYGVGETAPTLVQQEIFGANTNLASRKRDIAQAKSLLDGVELPASVTITTIEGVRKKMAEIIQANLLELGIDAQIQTLEWGAMLDEGRKGSMDMFMFGWTSVPPDSDIALSSLVLTDNKFTGGNYTAYSNPKVDDLVLKARSETNADARAAHYNEVLEILYEDLPMIPIFYPYSNAVTRKDIQGFKVDYFAVHDIKDLRQE